MMPRLPSCSCRSAYIWLDAHASTSTASKHSCAGRVSVYDGRLHVRLASTASKAANGRRNAVQIEGQRHSFAPMRTPSTAMQAPGQQESSPGHEESSPVKVRWLTFPDEEKHERQAAGHERDRLSRRQRLDRIQEIRHFRRNLHESRLLQYTYREPVGSIESMRTTSKERFWGALESSLAQLGSEDITDPLPYKAPMLHVVETLQEADRLLAGIKSGKALSLDVEGGTTELNFMAKVGLVQIATAEDIYILQISMMKELPLQLIRILDDETIIKCGVGIQQDSLRLMRDYGHQVRNAIELSDAAKLIDSEHWLKYYPGAATVSMRDLCRIYLDRRMKDGRPRHSKQWHAAILSEDQLEYAANDAYVGLEILHAIARRRILEYTGEDDPRDVLDHPSMDTVFAGARVAIPQLPPLFATLEKGLRESYLAIPSGVEKLMAEADPDDDAGEAADAPKALTRPQLRAFVNLERAAKRLESSGGLASLSSRDEHGQERSPYDAERALERVHMEGAPDVADLDNVSSNKLAIAVMDMWMAGAELRAMDKYLPSGLRYVMLLALVRDYARRPKAVNDELLSRFEREIDMARDDGCFQTMIDKMEERLDKMKWEYYRASASARGRPGAVERANKNAGVKSPASSALNNEIASIIVQSSAKPKSDTLEAPTGWRAIEEEDGTETAYSVDSKPPASRNTKSSSDDRSHVAPIDWRRLQGAVRLEET